MRFSNGLERIYSMGILLHDLHDFTKASLSNNLQQLEILNLERSRSVLNVFNTNSDLASTVLNILPLRTALPQRSLSICKLGRCLFLLLLAQFRILNVVMFLFEPWRDSGYTKNDVLT